MSLALLVPRAATLASSSSPRSGGERMAPSPRRSRGGCALVTPRASDSSSSSSSSSSPDREPFSPSSPLDFRPVFALSPPRGQPTLQDARDALETCDALSGQGRASCFASFGIDAERVDAYYGPVSRLEAALSSSAGVGLCSFGDEEDDDDEESENENDDYDDGGGGGGFRWPSLPGMPRW